ncbi:MAG: type II toxin-antitoxin system prevent-host-death family antitoxin [Alphaproteobacteria bacterium]|nr:type II toxin-antitoxin system prevent-host-death family antitoxin [Alphaproteobacteria bacterium]
MEVITYTKARQNFANMMKIANANHTPYHVTNKSGDDVVVISKTDFDAIQETMHLMSSPANAQRLNESILELESGKGKQHELIDS